VKICLDTYQDIFSQHAKNEAKNKNESKEHFRKTLKTKQTPTNNQRNTFKKRQKRSNKQQRIKETLSQNANNEATVTKLRKLATPANDVVNSKVGCAEG
jgi:hypothetical protein